MAEEWTTEAELAYTEKRGFTFYKSHHKLVLIHNFTLSPAFVEKTTWIMQAYGHVLSNVGVYTPAQFAEKIRESYSVINEHNLHACRILMNMDEVRVQEFPITVKGR